MTAHRIEAASIRTATTNISDPRRTLARASLRFTGPPRLSCDEPISDHDAEQDGQVGERVVEQRPREAAAPVDQVGQGEGHESRAKHNRAGQVEIAERPGREEA